MNKSGLLIIACVVVGLLAIGFSIGHVRAAPDNLLRAQGAVTSKRCIGGRRGRVVAVEFELGGSTQTYRYPDILPRVRELCERIRIGTEIDLLYATPGEPELWSTSIAGQRFVTVEEAVSARRTQAWWALALGVAFLLAGMKVWMRYGFRSRI